MRRIWAASSAMTAATRRRLLLVLLLLVLFGGLDTDTASMRVVAASVTKSSP